MDMVVLGVIFMLMGLLKTTIVCFWIWVVWIGARIWELRPAVIKSRPSRDSSSGFTLQILADMVSLVDDSDCIGLCIHTHIVATSCNVTGFCWLFLKLLLEKELGTRFSKY